MKQIFNSIGVLLTGLVAFNGAAYADSDLRCNDKQTYCVVDNRRLTIGDRVLVLNSDNEIIAHGQISGMNGQARRVNITKKVGRITSGSKVKTDSNGDIVELTNKYSYYRKPARAGFGLNAGITNLNVAGKTSAYGIEGFYQQRFMWDSLWTLRGHFFTASGSAREAEFEEETDFSMTGTLIYGGLAYEFWRKQPIMLRTEAGLGISYIGLSTTNTSAITFGGDAAPPEVDKIGVGLGLAGRFGAELGYTKLGSWKPTVGASYEQINQANGVTLNAGVIVDL